MSRPRILKYFVILVILIGILVAAVPRAEAMPMADPPTIHVELYGMRIFGTNFTANNTARIEVFENPDQNRLFYEIEIPIDEDGRFSNRPYGFRGLSPGYYVRVTDLASSIVKELTLPYLFINTKDLDADSVTGSAPAGDQVLAAVENDIDYITNYATANQVGIWTAYFGGFDIDEDTIASVFWWDEDDDVVEAFEFPDTFIQGGYDNDWMEFYWFSPNMTFDYQIRDSLDTFVASGQASTDWNGWTTITKSNHGIDFLPGYQVIGIDHIRNITETIILQDITTDVVNYDTNYLAGTAPPSSELIIVIGVEGGQISHLPDQTDGNGDWEADLITDHGFDLTLDHWVYATVNGPNGNSTFAALDQDGDETGNGLDNAILEFNPDQSDLDGDSVGDVIDPCPNLLENTCDPDRSAAISIDETGGVLTTQAGDTSITVPAGSLETDTSISITDTGEGYRLVSSDSSIQGESGEIWAVFSNFIGPQITTTIPMTITFTWSDSNNDGVVDHVGINEEDLLVLRNGVVFTGACSLFPGCDIDSNLLTFSVTSLGNFALAGERTHFWLYMPSISR